MSPELIGFLCALNMVVLAGSIIGLFLHAYYAPVDPDDPCHPGSFW